MKITASTIVLAAFSGMADAYAGTFLSESGCSGTVTALYVQPVHEVQRAFANIHSSNLPSDGKCDPVPPGTVINSLRCTLPRRIKELKVTVSLIRN